MPIGRLMKEDPLPAEMVGEQATQEWTCHRGHPEDGAEQALVLPPLARRDHVTDDGQSQRHQAAAAQPLDRTTGDHDVDPGDVEVAGDRAGEAADDRADQEHHDGGLEDRSASEQVGDLAPQRGRRRGGEQVRRHHPRQLVQSSQIRGDLGQGHPDDALIQGGQEHARHQTTHHHQNLLVAEIVPGGGCRRLGAGAGHPARLGRRRLERADACLAGRLRPVSRHRPGRSGGVPGDVVHQDSSRLVLGHETPGSRGLQFGGEVFDAVDETAQQPVELVDLVGRPAFRSCGSAGLVGVPWRPAAGRVPRR